MASLIAEADGAFTYFEEVLRHFSDYNFNVWGLRKLIMFKQHKAAKAKLTGETSSPNKYLTSMNATVTSLSSPKGATT